MSRWVTRGALGLAVGMGLAAWFPTSAVPMGLLMTVGIVAGVSLSLTRKVFIRGMGILIVFWIGMLLFTHAAERWQGLAETAQFSGSTEIITRGSERIFYRPMTLRPLSDDWRGGDILYRAPLDFAGTPGERIDFSCHLKQPENFESSFDYRMLLASRGIGYLCEHDGQATILPGDRNIQRAFFYRAQSEFRTGMETLLPEPEAGLLTGLLIGGSDSLSSETKETFARAGLSHIVAVSGYNMSILAEGLVILALMFGLWRRWATGAAAVGLGFFLLMIDGSAASIRAALMAWFAFGAYFALRPNVSWNGLLIAGASMLIMNPLLLRFDVGFQLSFLATLALLVFTRYLETFDWLHSWYGKISALFLATIIIELFTFPVIVSAFGSLSIIAPLANTIILPLVPVAMLAGFVAVISTLLLPGIGALIASLVWLPLTAIIRFADGFASIPGASVSGLDISPIFALCWYLGLGLTVYILERIRKHYVLGMDH